MRFPRLRFTLRTLFIVVTLAAVALGAFIVPQIRIIAKRKAIVAEIQAADGPLPFFDGAERVGPPPKPLPWYRLMLGDIEVQIIVVPDSIRNRAEDIRELFPEAVVYE